MELDTFSLLTKLPAPSSTPPQVAGGTVVLFKDNNWNSSRTTLSTRDYREGARHTIPKSGYDNATYIAYNLPVGTVMTLVNHLTPVDEESGVADLKGCGGAVDLVGTGKTEGVDLTALHINDALSAFFWRKVDLDVGAIELFADSRFRGMRSTLFLCEWSKDEVHSLAGWWLQDKISSIRWKSLDRQEVDLFNNADGSGAAYQNITGYSSTDEIADLKDIRINDALSSFRWRPLNPKKEVVHLFEVRPESSNNTTWLSTEQQATNYNSGELQKELTFEFEKDEEISISTTDTFATGVTASASRTLGPEASSTTLSIEVSFSYEHTTEETHTYSKSISLTTTETVTVPPHSLLTAYLAAQIAEMPPTEFKTTAERWYDQQVRNSELDPSNGWYKRTEQVTLSVQGGLASSIHSYVKTEPLPGYEPDDTRRPRQPRTA